MTEKSNKYGTTVELQPSGKKLELPYVTSVHQLLNKVGARKGTVLVIRDGKLLTPDRKLFRGDELIVRTVVSAG
ncbi:MoaD/ThiS family protein [Oleidesulfovibrio sp.]|uniref:MoaD/ThiS family protein n=1 Tax=Oleidesulfovibrio sp. TaxID=2909707 RepID=UPI003A8B4B50